MNKNNLSSKRIRLSKKLQPKKKKVLFFWYKDLRKLKKKRKKPKNKKIMRKKDGKINGKKEWIEKIIFIERKKFWKIKKFSLQKTKKINYIIMINEIDRQPF